ncbi:MAG TPA: DUF1080 domain-containing protein [Luteitalea sp.]|nr:DUF1080 domain-containing protein [Luteitalea sp.]
MPHSRSSSRLQVSLVALAATAALGASVLASSTALRPVAAAAQSTDNTLTAQEKSAGWRLLFDGTSTKGWRNAHADTFPSKGWQVKDGLLTVLESGGGEAAHGGDIVTLDEYGDFEFKVDVRLSKGANSGIKYFVTEKLGTPGRGSAIGLEFQLLDDAVHPDAKAGREGNRTFGSLYDLIAAPASKPVKPIGEWNTAHIVSKGTKVEHWLNGTKLIEFDRASDAFKKLVATSKYKDYKGFGEAKSGHLLLQDHGNSVSFRNVKVKGAALPNT